MGNDFEPLRIPAPGRWPPDFRKARARFADFRKRRLTPAYAAAIRRAPFRLPALAGSADAGAADFTGAKHLTRNRADQPCGANETRSPAGSRRAAAMDCEPELAILFDPGRRPRLAYGAPPGDPLPEA